MLGVDLIGGGQVVASSLGVDGESDADRRDGVVRIFERELHQLPRKHLDFLIHSLKFFGFRAIFFKDHSVGDRVDKVDGVICLR